MRNKLTFKMNMPENNFYILIIGIASTILLFYNIYIGCDFKSDFEENVKNSLGIDFGRKIIVENMRYKGNPKFDEFFEVENKLAENIDVGIYEEKEAFVLQNGKIDIEIDGEFGKGVRNLITFIANR